MIRVSHVEWSRITYYMIYYVVSHDLCDVTWSPYCITWYLCDVTWYMWCCVTSQVTWVCLSRSCSPSWIITDQLASYYKWVHPNPSTKQKPAETIPLSIFSVPLSYSVSHYYLLCLPDPSHFPFFLLFTPLSLSSPILPPSPPPSLPPYLLLLLP